MKLLPLLLLALMLGGCASTWGAHQTSWGPCKIAWLTDKAEAAAQAQVECYEPLTGEVFARVTGRAESPLLSKLAPVFGYVRTPVVDEEGKSQ